VILSQITEKRTLGGFSHGAGNHGKKWAGEKILYLEGTKKSKSDLLAGKQLSIEWALRAR
jgi:hypothetical protein